MNTLKATKTNKKKVMAWLRMQANSYKRRYFSIGLDVYPDIRTIDSIDGIHLGDARYVGELLGFELIINPFDSRKNEVMFMFDGVKFFSLEKAGGK